MVDKRVKLAFKFCKLIYWQIKNSKLSCQVIAFWLNEVLKISYKDHTLPILWKTLQLGAPKYRSIGTRIPNENGVQSKVNGVQSSTFFLLLYGYPRGHN